MILTEAIALPFYFTGKTVYDVLLSDSLKYSGTGIDLNDGLSAAAKPLYMEIHPNAFATELTRMTAAKIGQRYWIMNWKTALRRNG